MKIRNHLLSNYRIITHSFMEWRRAGDMLAGRPAVGLWGQVQVLYFQGEMQMHIYPSAFSFPLQTWELLEQQSPTKLTVFHQTVCVTLWLRCWEMLWAEVCLAPVLRARTTFVIASKDLTFFIRKSTLNQTQTHTIAWESECPQEVEPGGSKVGCEEEWGSFTLAPGILAPQWD